MKIPSGNKKTSKTKALGEFQTNQPTNQPTNEDCLPTSFKAQPNQPRQGGVFVVIAEAGEALVKSWLGKIFVKCFFGQVPLGSHFTGHNDLIMCNIIYMYIYIYIYYHFVNILEYFLVAKRLSNKEFTITWYKWGQISSVPFPWLFIGWGLSIYIYIHVYIRIYMHDYIYICKCKYQHTTFYKAIWRPSMATSKSRTWIVSTKKSTEKVTYLHSQFRESSPILFFYPGSPRPTKVAGLWDDSCKGFLTTNWQSLVGLE